MTPIIRLTSVSKRFGRVKALDDISLNVQPGTVCAILGANGAGKSTAIRLLLGFELPDRGEIDVLDGAFAVRTAMGEVLTPFGVLSAGRMPSHFGLGIGQPLLERPERVDPGGVAPRLLGVKRRSPQPQHEGHRGRLHREATNGCKDPIHGFPQPSKMHRTQIRCDPD